MTPFSNKIYAEKRFSSIPGAFAITQVADHLGWWIVAKDKYGVYQIYGASGVYKIAPENNAVFESLESRSTGIPSINNPLVYEEV